VIQILKLPKLLSLKTQAGVIGYQIFYVVIKINTYTQLILHLSFFK